MRRRCINSCRIERRCRTSRRILRTLSAHVPIRSLSAHVPIRSLSEHVPIRPLSSYVPIRPLSGWLPIRALPGCVLTMRPPLTTLREPTDILLHLLPTTHHQSPYGYLFDPAAAADTAFGMASTVPTRAISLPIWGPGGDGSPLEVGAFSSVLGECPDIGDICLG